MSFTGSSPEEASAACPCRNELLTSKPPFFTGDLLNQVRNVMVKPLQERLRELKLANDIPRHVEDLIIACLSKVELQRPQKAREVAQWLSSGQRPGSVKRRRGVMTVAFDTVRGRKGWFSGAAAVAIAIAAAWGIIRRPSDKARARDVTQSAPRPSAEGALSPAPAVTPQQRIVSG